jgi:hypothetical protein
VLGWLLGIATGVVVAAAIFVLALWAFGNSAELAPKMLSISAIFSIAAGIHIGRRVKRRISDRASSPR